MTEGANQSLDFLALYSQVIYNTTSHYTNDNGLFSNRSHGNHQIWDYEVLVRAYYNDRPISNDTNETGIWDFDMPEMPNVDEFQPMFTAIYIIVFLCSLFGNLLVLIVIARNYKARAVTNLFLANLALADLLQCIGCIIPTLLLYVVEKYWIFGKVLCRCLYFLQMLAHTSSISLLTGISVERYYVIVYPIRSRFLNKRRMKIILIVIWSLSCAYSLPWIFLSEYITGFDGKSYCIYAQGTYKLVKIYDTVTFVLFYCLPLTILTFMYSRMASELYSHSTLQADSNPYIRKSSILDTVLRYCGRQRPSSGITSWTITMPRAHSTATPTSVTSPDVRLPAEQADSAMMMPRSVTASTMFNFNDNTADTRLPVVLGESGIPPTDSKSKQPQANDTSTIPGKNRAEKNSRNERKKSTSRSDVERDTTSTTPELGIVHSTSQKTDRCFALARRVSLTHHSDAIRPNELNLDGTSQNASHHQQLPDTAAMHQPVASKTSVSSQNSSSSSSSRKSKKASPYKRKVSSLSSMSSYSTTLITGRVSPNGPFAIRARRGLNIPLLTPPSAQETPIPPHDHAARRDTAIHGSILKMKRKVIRLLMAIVGTFAIWGLPHYIRLMWQYWGSLPINKNIIIFLHFSRIILFLNPALDPLLYALMSDNFRRQMRQAFTFQSRRNSRSSAGSNRGINLVFRRCDSRGVTARN